MANYTLQDITGSIVAVLAFAVVLVAPGYVLCQLTNLFEFRTRSSAERLTWAVACSFTVAPITAYFAGRYAGLSFLCWAAIALAAGAVVAMVKGRSTSSRPLLLTSRACLFAGGLLAAWTAFVIASLVDVQVGSKLYFSVSVFDQGYRVAFTDAVTRTGIPPANPLFFAGQLHPMRYYYFWYVICAMVQRIAHVSARAAFIASSVWAGIGLAAVIALYTRYFFAARDTRRQAWCTVALVAVTGADLLPALGGLIAPIPLNGEMEWWSNDQISSWIDSLLWVPHHLAALLCCLMSFLLLWRTREPRSAAQRAGASALAGIAFASAFGLSIYLAFGYALLMVAWVARLAIISASGSFAARGCSTVRPGATVPGGVAAAGWVAANGVESGTALYGRVLLAGVVSAVMLTPFVRELMRSASNLPLGSSAPHLFSLSVRRLIDPQLVAGLPLFSAWNQAHPRALDEVLRLLLLAPGLALELGFYGAVLALYWRARRRLSEAQATALYLAVCGLFMVIFLRSSVISNNDFGYRAALLPQFFLLLLGGSLVNSWWGSEAAAVIPATPRKRYAIGALLVLGVAGTVYQAIMLRAFLPIEEMHPGSGFAYLPAAAFQARDAFARLDRVALPSAVLEFHPRTPATDSRGDVVPPFLFLERILLMDSGHQLLNAEECAAEFGGDSRACAPIRQATDRLYARPAPSAAEARQYCQHFGVDYLIATPEDGAWSDPAGWAAVLPSVASEPNLKILACGSQIGE